MTVLSSTFNSLVGQLLDWQVNVALLAIIKDDRLQYGLLGHEIADVLGYTPPERKNGEPMWFWTLSSGNDASETTIDSHYEFVMRPELAAALEYMKWVKAIG